MPWYAVFTSDNYRDMMVAMFVRKKRTKNNPNVYIQLVESYRKEGSIAQKVIKHIGTAVTDEQLEQIVLLANKIKEMYLKYKNEHEIEVFRKQELSKINGSRSLTLNCIPIKKIIKGLPEIYGKIFDEMHLNKIINNRSNYNEVLKYVVIGRIACLGSKKKIGEQLEQKFDKKYDLNSIYRTMDKLTDEVIELMKINITKYNQNLLQGKIKVLFYDTTTIYFECFTEDELKKLGFSKDLKFNQPQIVLTLLVTEQGLPLAYQLFPGNTYEGNTLLLAMRYWKSLYPEQKITLVADSGMLNNVNLENLESEGFDYIVCARLKSFNKTVQNMIISNKQAVEDDCFYNINLDNRRLVVSYRQNRATKDYHDRVKSIERLTNKLKQSSSPTNLISNYGYKKYITVDRNSKIKLNEEKILEAEQWDGLHGLVTNIQDTPAEEIYAYYRGLYQIEDAFRINKTDLKIRPIFHWTPERVKAHIAISYMAYCCYKAVEFKVNKFIDEKLSHRAIREILEETQVAIYEDKYSKEQFCMPLPIPAKAQEIYNSLDLTLRCEPYRYLS